MRFPDPKGGKPYGCFGLAFTLGVIAVSAGAVLGAITWTLTLAG